MIIDLVQQSEELERLNEEGPRSGLLIGIRDEDEDSASCLVNLHDLAAPIHLLIVGVTGVLGV